MRLFRRKRGRHALGAAVTSIPSGPPIVPLPPVPAAPAGPAVSAFQPELLSSVASLLASGDAWQEPAAAVPAPPVVPPAPVQADPGSARTSLDAALAQLLPQQADPAPPRVQLGFRDGTSATLEPGSDQALALELLAQSLTRRD